MEKNNQPIRILFAEDLPTDAEMARREIKKEGIEFTHRVVDTEAEFKKELDAFAPDIVVSDYSMPTFDGMEALKITRSFSRHIPFIILTGSMNEETAVACMKAGANDYVIKEQIKRLPFAILEALEKNHSRMERMRMEVKLQESEAMYRSLIENSNDAIYLLHNRKFEIINSGFERMFGYTSEELNRPGFDFTDLVAPESKEYIENRNNRIKKWEKIDNRYEFNAIKKNGQKINVEASVSYINFKGDIATQGIIRDITQHKNTEERIRYQSNFRNLLVKLSSNFIFVPLEQIETSIRKSLAQLGEFVGADRAYIFDYDFDNNTYANTFEWCREGISPQIDSLQAVSLDNIPDWVKNHTEGKNIVIPDISQLKPKKLQQILEKQHIKSLLTIPLNNEDECIGFVGFDSVSKKHQYENDEIEILQVYAKMLVNSFERQRREKELISAKEKAEESDRLKSAFLANMSHEIRTPMNGILGFTELLKEADLTSNQHQKYIDIIQQSGNRMLDTVNDLIDISHIETGQIKLSLTKTNLNELLDNLFDFFKHQAKQKGLHFSCKKTLPDSNAELSADKNKLNSVLSNLIKNAIKFTDKGSIEIGSSLKKSQVVFYVKDTGIGIPSERQKAIFNRFEQADIEDTKAFQGSGLGLAISKAYVEMMGGEIWLHSKKDEGSVFYFTLPFNRNKDASTLNVKISGNDSKPVFNRKLKVLITEDDEVSYLYISALLKGPNYQLFRTVTGTEAIQFCKDNKNIDLVLMDIQLPELNGYEATKTIRKFNPGIVIIAQTAYTLSGDREKAIAAGCDDYITKPIKKRELLDKMARALSKKIK